MQPSKEFKLTLPIVSYVTRAMTGDHGLTGNYMFVKAWASDTSKDLLRGQFSERAVLGMVSCVNDGKPTPVFERAAPVGKVGIDVEHSSAWPDQIGQAFAARAIYDLAPEMLAAGVSPPVMEVECAIDLDMSHGMDLKRSLDKGVQLGMSVYGTVIDGHEEVNRSDGKIDQFFDLVDLKRIAVTQRPVNQNTWLAEVARSMDGVKLPMMENKATVAATVTDEREQMPAVTNVPTLEDCEEGEVDDEKKEPASDQALEEPTQVQRGQPEGTGDTLAPDALADLASLGAPVAPAAGLDAQVTAELAAIGVPVERSVDAAPTPAVSPSLETPAVEVEVARAEEPVVESAATLAAEIVTPVNLAPEVERAFGEVAVLRTEMSVFRSQLAALPDVITGVSNEVSRALADLAAAQKLIAALQQENQALVARVTGVENARQGRKGAALLRGMGEVVDNSPVLGDELTPEQRLEVLRSLRDKNETGVAAMFAARLLQRPSTEGSTERRPPYAQ